MHNTREEADTLQLLIYANDTPGCSMHPQVFIRHRCLSPDPRRYPQVFEGTCFFTGSKTAERKTSVQDKYTNHTRIIYLPHFLASVSLLELTSLAVQLISGNLDVRRLCRLQMKTLLSPSQTLEHLPYQQFNVNLTLCGAQVNKSYSDTSPLSSK